MRRAREGKDGELVVDDEFMMLEGDPRKGAVRHRRPDSTYSYNSN